MVDGLGMTHVGGSDDRLGRSAEGDAAVAASNAAARAALGGGPARASNAAPAAAAAPNVVTDLDESPDNRWLALGVVNMLAAFGVAVLTVPGEADEQQTLGRLLVILGTAMLFNAGITRRAFAPMLDARGIRLARSERTDAEVVAAETSRGVTTHTVRFTDHRGVPREACLPFVGAARIGDRVAIRFDREEPTWALDEVSATAGMRRLRAIGPSMAALGAGAALVGLLVLLV